MAEAIKIDIYRSKSVDELTKIIAVPGEKPEIGSAASTAAANAAALLARAAAGAAEKKKDDEQLAWYVRNTEILRAYMVKLIDEDVKCKGPLRRALKEGREEHVEAARQTAVSICLEIVNMMGKCLEMTEGLLTWAEEPAERADLAACADLAMGASLAAGRYVLSMSALSDDETYRYVMKRENELTVQEQKARYERICSASSPT